MYQEKTREPKVTHMPRIADNGTYTHVPQCANRMVWSPLLATDPTLVTCERCNYMMLTPAYRQRIDLIKLRRELAWLRSGADIKSTPPDDWMPA